MVLLNMNGDTLDYETHKRGSAKNSGHRNRKYKAEGLQVCVIHFVISDHTQIRVPIGKKSMRVSVHNFSSEFSQEYLHWLYKIREKQSHHFFFPSFKRRPG